MTKFLYLVACENDSLEPCLFSEVLGSIPLLQRPLLQFFRNIAGKCSTIHHTVMIWVHWTTTYSQNSRTTVRCLGLVSLTWKWPVFCLGLRDSVAQQKPAHTWNRKAARMLAIVHFVQGGLHWRVISSSPINLSDL